MIIFSGALGSEFLHERTAHPLGRVDLQLPLESGRFFAVENYRSNAFRPCNLGMKFSIKLMEMF